MKYYLLMLLCNTFMYIVILQFHFKLYERKTQIKSVFLIPMGAAWVIVTLLISELFSIPLLNFLISYLFTLGITFWFKGSILKKALCTLMISVLSASCDLAAFLILSRSMSSTQIYEISYIFTVILFWGAETIITATMKHAKLESAAIKEFFVLFSIPLCLLIVLYLLTESGMDKNSIEIASIVIMLCCVGMFYAYYIVNTNLNEKYNNLFLKKSVAAYRNELEWIKKSELKVEGMRHDLKNHLIELKSLVEKKDYEHLADYIDSMYSDLPHTKKYSRSGMYEIDSLINYLIEEEGSGLKDVSIKVTIPSDIEINRYKLNIILGNLLQNAIYASMNSDKKKLSLELKYHCGILHLDISNSFSNSIVMSDGEIVSTKNEKGMHGIGLKNVKRLIAEQNGEMEININEDIFDVKVMVYL